MVPDEMVSLEKFPEPAPAMTPSKKEKTSERVPEPERVKEKTPKVPEKESEKVLQKLAERKAVEEKAPEEVPPVKDPLKVSEDVKKRPEEVQKVKLEQESEPAKPLEKIHIVKPKIKTEEETLHKGTTEANPSSLCLQPRLTYTQNNQISFTYIMKV